MEIWSRGGGGAIFIAEMQSSMAHSCYSTKLLISMLENAEEYSSRNARSKDKQACSSKGVGLVFPRQLCVAAQLNPVGVPQV